MRMDVFGLPPTQHVDQQIYLGSGLTPSPSAAPIPWAKPHGVSMVWMTAISGGGGGGAGCTRTSGNNGGGGGGGACSGISRLLVPAYMVPDILWIFPGNGGVGGAPAAGTGGAGSAGGNSFVCLSQTIADPNVIFKTNENSPGGGGGGTTAGGGAAGSTPTVAITKTFQTLGLWASTAGIVGLIGGGVAAVGTPSNNVWQTLPMSPGAGGAGITATAKDGGPQTAVAVLDLGPGGYYTAAAGGVAAAGTGVTQINGSAGVWSVEPFFNSGGAGGGSSNTGSGGNGGDGGIGCGGGGGGAGATAGYGGRGGPGLIIITSW